MTAIAETTPLVWHEGDPPERLWEMLSYAQMHTSAALLLRPGPIMRVPKNPHMDSAGAFVLDGDLAFWAKEIRLEARTLSEILLPILNAYSDAEEQLKRTIAALLGVTW